MTSRRRPKPAVLRVALGLTYSVVVAALLLEIFLRVFDPIGIRYYFDSAVYFKAMQPSDEFAYLHAPGYRARLQGAEVRINSEGLRGPEFQPAKGDRKRILVLGDSVVFGWGAPQDSIFSAVLQRLIDRDGLDYEVIAAGAGSWNTRTEFEFLRRRALAYEPDVVILLAVPNDVEPKEVGRTFIPMEALHGTRAVRVTLKNRMVRQAAKRSYLVATMRHILQRRTVAARLLAMYEKDSPQWLDTENALAGVAEICVAAEIKLIAFLYADMQSDFSRAFHDAYAPTLTDLGATHHVLGGYVFDPAYRNSVVDGHPNAAGHRLIAEQMYARIRAGL